MCSRFVSEIGNSTIEIIDCLSPLDMQTGISIFNHLRDLTPGNVPRIRRHAISSAAEFWGCLDGIESQCVAGWKPIIHVEAHADKTGVEIRNQGDVPSSILPWAALVDRFRSINIASGFNLGVFMAACEGVEAIRPMTIKKAAPYMFLLGPNTQVSAEVVKDAAEGFYNVIINTPDLNRAFGSLPQGFTAFLAERFLATTYARVLKAQSFGRRRKERVNSLVNMVIPDDAHPEQLRTVREMARLFARPDRVRFEAVQQNYLPRGVSFTFDDLVEFARTGKIPE